MTSEQFQVAYDGPAVQTAMDIYELAPALLSIGDLIRESNAFLNQDRATVSIRVESGFRRGSFEISLIVDQNLLEAARAVLFGATAINAPSLVETIFGTASKIGDGASGLLKLYKLFKGEKPASSCITINDHSTTIIFNDSPITIDSKTADLYLNDGIRFRLDKMLRPVAQEGIERLEVRKGKAVVDEIKKNDLPARVFEEAEDIYSGDSNSYADTQEMLVKVVKPNLDKGKWTFSDGSSKFNAAVEDVEFLRQVDSRQIGFYKGDVFRVVRRTVQTSSTGRLHSEHFIERVLEHRPSPEQRKLLPPKDE